MAAAVADDESESFEQIVEKEVIMEQSPVVLPVFEQVQMGTVENSSERMNEMADPFFEEL